jgi:hypothetical protein
MNLMLLLEPEEAIQTGDLFYSFERKALEEITVIKPGSVLSDGSPVFRAVTNEALTAELVARHKSGDLSDDEMILPLEQVRLLGFAGEERMLLYVAERYPIPEVLSHFSDDDVEEYVGSSEYAIDSMPENKGASFWKEECSQLLKEVIAKQGWDVVYNRIRDLDFMQPEEQLVFSPENPQI